jgi:hypothetical protein
MLPMKMPGITFCGALSCTMLVSRASDGFLGIFCGRSITFHYALNGLGFNCIAVDVLFDELRS